MKTVKLTDLCHIRGGIPAPKVTAQMGHIPFVRMRELGESHLSSAFSPTQEYLIQSDEAIFESKLVGEGAILFPRSGSVHLNHRALLCTKVAIVSHIAALVPKANVDPAFLYHLLTAYDMTEIMTQTTGLNMIKFGQLANVEFEVPECIKEQTKIAEVLSTVDRAIEQTEALIAKQQRIKTGLMQDLLTRGIDEHGNLRSEETHEFKDSPLGRIPIEWDCRPLLHFVPSAQYGISSALGDYGSPVLRMNNLADGEAEISDLKFTELPIPDTLWLQNGDVLFNRTNSWEHVGRTGIWRCQLDRTTFASYLVRLNPHPARLLSDLLNLWLNWHNTQIAMRRLATPAVQQVNINPTNLRSIDAAFPKHLSEQEKISDRYAVAQKAIHSSGIVLDKLRCQKAALMQDLLTGKKRVTPLLESQDIAAQTP